MSDKKVKISNILGSQIPDFIQAENPLFKEFFNQYYESQEREYGTTYISDNIPSFKNITTVSGISLAEKQTVNEPGSSTPAAPAILESLIYAYDDEITVDKGEGFPDTYGLLKIDDEIITYTGKQKNITNIGTNSGEIYTEYSERISGISTTNIKIGDVVSLSSSINEVPFEVKTISILEGTRVSGIGINEIIVDRPIYSTSALEKSIRQFTYSGGENSNFGRYIVIGETLTGNGTGSSFEVTIPETGVPIVKLINSGKNYAVGDRIALSNVSIVVTVSEIINLNYIPITSDNPLKGVFTFKRESFTFTGCARGFSGISAIETNGSPEYLTFSLTNAAVHSANSLVVNLSFLFIKQFYKKFRRNFLPGLEGRQFGYGLSVENILSRARDFYISKGTDTSLKILFQVLYGEEVDIIKPFDQTILPSKAEWNVTDDIVVESIFGDPSNLIGVKIYQNSFTNPTASGTVSNVNTKFLGDKKYYQISFSKGTIKDEFKVSTKTKVADNSVEVISSDPVVVTVDSTIGFEQTGNFYYLNDNNAYVLAEYTSKSSNQFFGCRDVGGTSISKILKESDAIIDLNFVYGYEDNDLNKVCQMRVVGSIAGTADNVSISKYFDIDELIKVKHLGEKYSVDDNRFNTWFYNNISYIDVIQHPAGSANFKTSSEHFLKIGDRVDIIFKDTGSKVLENIRVFAVNNSKEFQTTTPVDVFGDYIIKKRLNYASENFGITKLLSNIQNSFVDSENNAYVAFSGFPSFDTNTTNRSKSILGSGITSEFSISNHNFLNGEKVYVGLTSTSLKGSDLSGYYFVNPVDENNIRLSISNANLTQNIFESLDITENSSVSPSIPFIIPAELHDGKKLENQNNFKRIYRTPKIKSGNYNIFGPVGVSLNGVEFHSPIDRDRIFYGKIKNIEILNSGNNFDVIQSPLLSISDENGSGCIANANFSGSLTEVVLDNSGFDYLDVPSVKIKGGNGSGAICEAKMRGLTHRKSYNESGIDVANNAIGRSGEHKFSDGEEVRYLATGTPIGIAGTVGDVIRTVGFTTDRLLSDTTYFVAKINEESFRLATTEKRAITKTNLIEFSDDGNQTHTFISKKIRKIIDRIIVNNPGTSYDKHQIFVRSNSFPELLTTDYQSEIGDVEGGGRIRLSRYPTEIVSGINTENNYIYAQNHDFKNGDIVEYMCNTFDDRIVGLNTITQYKVTKISDDKFKLSDKGPDEDANYAVGFTFHATNRLVSHTYVDGATSWQQVDNHGNEAGFVKLNLKNLRSGEKYRVSLHTDFQINFDGGGRKPRVTHDTGGSTKFLDWDGGIGVLTGEFTATSENNEFFLFYVAAVDGNNRTANITDFKVELIENNIEDYERKIYANLSSVGVGTHTFKYPDINLKINGTVSVGKTDVVPSYYKASATPVVKGTLKSIFITDGGVGYGVTNVINYMRQPQVKLLTGDENALLRPIIVNGKITNVEIVDGGTNYTTPPNLEVVGIGGTSGTIGQFAELKSVILDGKIIDVTIVEGGSGYDLNNTSIKIIPSGSGAIVNTEIYDWQIDSVKRYEYTLDDNNNQLLQLKGNTSNKICSFYPVKKYRRLLRDNIDADYVESTDNHSKIVGWAYDGNPIYGPVGNRGNEFNFMKSGYKLNSQNKRLNLINRKYRPPGYENGFFIKDYVFDESGDLDVNNGKFVINSDFPEGTYAYFSTIDESTKKPSFPYITFSHRDLTDSFNYLATSKQTDDNLNSGSYKRTVTHLGLNDKFKRYPLLLDSLDSKPKLEVNSVKSSTITNIVVDQSGLNYKVNDKINFNDPTVLAEVSEVIGKPIISVKTTSTVIDNLKFNIIDGKVTGISTIPHGLSSGDIVEITGISSTFYKNIEGIRTIGVSSVSSGLSTSIPNLNATGITTFVTFSDSSDSRKFKVNDVVKIGSEQFLILGHDDVNNRYRVRRKHNQTAASAHSAGTIVEKSETEFTYSVSKKIKNKNVESSAVSYFEGNASVGVGTTTSNVIIGNLGNNSGIGTIYKSIPAKAIYLPNHDFKDGDEVKLVSVGSTINATKKVTLTDTFDLSTFDKLYCSKISDDFIGLSTEKSSFKTNQVFFKEVLVDIREEFKDDHKIEKIVDNISGFLRKVNGTVNVLSETTTGQQHGLSVNDKFKLHITSNNVQTFDLRYNSTIGKLIVNPLSFTSSAIAIGATDNSTITINNHDFQTGDLIVYNSSTPASPLIDNGVYYVIRDSINTIRLAENSYDLSTFPINHISIGTTGGQNHQISKINPKLTFYKNNVINFVTSDSSLTDFDIDFYKDINFKSKYNTNLITKETGNIRILVEDSISNEFFYRIQGKRDNYSKTLFLPVDERVSDYAKIEVVDSLFNNKEYTVTGIGSTTFNFNPKNIAEVDSYTSSGFSSAFYSTNSTGEVGGVHSVKILNNGISNNKLPIITSIGTSTGVNAVFSVESDNIGSISNTKVINQGLEFSPDKTLKPKANSNVLLKLKDTLTLESIGVSSGGRNYTSSPNVLAIGKPLIVAQTFLNGSTVEEVKILTNDTGLSEDLRIIPVVNSNGIVVRGATIDSNETVTLDLRAPNPDVGTGSDSGFYNNSGSFPFKIGDEIFVENIKITNDANGYNSGDYNYKYFTVTGINTTGGEESVSYSLAGLGVSTGGLYQELNNFGRVIKKDDLAIFTPIFKRTSFIDDEVVKVIGKNVEGIVARNGWEQLSESLKVFDATAEFESGQIIVGDTSNNKGTITKQLKFDFDLNVDSTATNINGWKNDTGKLNLETQRIHDNDYYQRFSYSIKGAVPFTIWKDAIDSLNHVAGFKNFCNLGVGTAALSNLKPTSESDIEFNVNIDEDSSVHERFFYDMVSEDTEDENLSKLVIFNSKILTDYNESKTNKVILIDDISSQFTGIVTSTGGGVIGTTSFNLFSQGSQLFHKEFNPSTIDTSTHQLSIPNHNFNTGEKLIYKPNEGQSSISIEEVSDTNAGIAATTILPSEVFAIKIDSDNIQVAIASSLATAGVAVSFTNVSGIGSINSLSVPSDDATIRSLITIDNIIQSPVGITTMVSVGLLTALGSSNEVIFLNDASEILGKSLLRIEDEIIKVNLVGVGSTNSLNVVRGEMGTVAAAHTVGAAVTVLKGDYRINEGRLYFSEAPYGPKGVPDPESPTNPDGVTTLSTFSGRAYYRLNYDTNTIIDDISDRFDGSTDQFNLTSNGLDVPVIDESFGAFLINNIFQRPFLKESGSILKSDYTLVGTGQTIDFTGTSGNKDLPRGGIIDQFDVAIGSGYEPPRKALFSAVVSVGGTIQSVGIASGGAGYLTPPLISVVNPKRHYKHVFISSNSNSVNVTGGSQLTPTDAVYISETGLLTLTIPNHGLTLENTVTLDNNSLIFRCSKDNYSSDHPYPRSTDPASGTTLEIMAFTTNTITLDVGLGGGVDAIITSSITAGVVTSVTIVNPGTGYTNTGISTSLNFVTAAPPSPYKDIPLSGGNGSGATMDVVVGTGGSIVSFDMSNRGIGYEIGDNLELTTLPLVGIGTSVFNITVKSKFQDKFAGWCFGQLIELDDFSSQFNGFRKNFLLTRTKGGEEREYYSIVAAEGSGIILKNNFLIFINDVLQRPDEDFLFESGTRISFREAPKAGSKFKIYFYTGSEQDFNQVDVDETIKPGDELRLQYFRNKDTGIVESEQDNRVVYELIAADTIETTTYSGLGISTDADFKRPTMWRKQINDLVIDGENISKERNYLSARILPTTGIIKSISPSDQKIRVKDAWSFKEIDGLDQTLNDISIVGMGTTAVVEKLEEVGTFGDFGIITGIGTSATGINTTGPAIFFEVEPDPTIYDQNGAPTGNELQKISRSGINTGDYFVIKNTFIGDGVTGIRTTSSGPETVCVGNNFLDNVYYAEHIIPVGLKTLRVFANVDSISGINTNPNNTGLSTYFKSGNYSWGVISATRSANSKSFTFHNQNGILGIETSTQVVRTLPITTTYSI